MKINGSLVFDASSASEIQNLRVQKILSGANPAWSASDVGRLIYNSTANIIYVGGAADWVALATGGNATAIQDEVNNIETSLGSIVTSGGVFVPGQISVGGVLSTATTLTGLLTELAAFATGKDTLDEILPGTAGQVIYNNAGTWALAVPGATSGVQAYDAFLTSVGTLGTAPDKLVYVTGVDTAAETNFTAFGRSLVDDADSAAGRTTLGVVIGTDVQAFDADLSSLAALTPATLGQVIVTTAGGYELQTAATARTTLGVAIGTNVQAYDADLSQLAGFAPADGEFIVGTGGAEGARYSLESGATVRSSLGLGDIATLDASAFIRTNGASAVTANIPFGGFKLTGLGNGTVSTDAVNLAQLEAAVNGLSWKTAVRVAADTQITLSGTQTIDGVAVDVGNRVLVKGQTLPQENGIYVVAAGAWVRSTDMDSASEFDGSAVFVQEGTVHQGTGWTETATVTTVGTTPVAYSQFSGGQAFIWGTGLVASGNTINVKLGSGIFEQGDDAVGIELHNALSGAIILTTDGTTRGISDATKLHLLTNTIQLDQDEDGLFIKASGITETELAASVAGAGLAGGAGTALSVVVDNSSIEINVDTVRVKAAGVTNAMLSTLGAITLKSNAGTQSEGMVLGEDLNFEATAGTGVTVAVSAGNTVTVAGVNATDAVKGVASFNATDFTVTAGVVTVNAKNLDNLTDVVIAGAATGQTLVYSTAAAGFVNRKVFHTEAVGSSSTWVITHGLGQKFCNVTVADATDEVVIPQSIKFDSATQLTVTFNTAIAGSVMVSGVSGA